MKRAHEKVAEDIGSLRPGLGRSSSQGLARKSDAMFSRSALDNVHLEIPFMLLSTHVNPQGETEKRFLTPFGAIDVRLGTPCGNGAKGGDVSIEIRGDIENWLTYDAAIHEFKTALVRFVSGILREDLGNRGVADFTEMTVAMKGAEISLTLALQGQRCAHKDAAVDPFQR